MKLLCKLVTNLLKPKVCAHPINLCNSLGSGLSDLHHCVGCGRGPWLESVINFPFLPVALSWRPSVFLLRDLDIRHNNCSHEIKRCLFLGRKAMTKLDSILNKRRHHFTVKGPYSQSYCFSRSHVQM